jgi:CheY-like chemotaxis protein
MGGNINVTSQVGKGTTFTVLIPDESSLNITMSPNGTSSTEESPHHIRAPATEIQSQSQNENPNSSYKVDLLEFYFSTEHPPRVLVVDDSPINQKVISTILSRAGCIAMTASNGEEAVNHFVQNSFDVVLMDLIMPVMNGFEATQAIRKRESELKLKPTPIIALSGFSQEREKQKAFDVGMNCYLVKPIRSNELFTRLSDLLHPAA